MKNVLVYILMTRPRIPGNLYCSS